MISLLVLCQHNEVPSALVNTSVLQSHVVAARNIHLASEDRHEIGYAFVLFDRFLQISPDFVNRASLVPGRRKSSVINLRESLLICLYGFFCLSPASRNLIKKLLHAHHIAMIGKRHTLHSVGYSLINHLLYRSLSVENGVLRVNV